jgi:hypothetical protein
VTRVVAWVRRQVTAHQALARAAADGWAESLLIALADPRTAGRHTHRTVLVLGVAS